MARTQTRNEIPPAHVLYLQPGKRTRDREHIRVEFRIDGERRLEEVNFTLTVGSAAVLYLLAASEVMRPGCWVNWEGFAPDGATAAKTLYRLQEECRTGGGVEIPIENDKQGNRRLRIPASRIVIWPTMLENFDNVPVRELLLKAAQKKSGRF